MAKLGIQLIVFGSRTREDLPGVLREVKAAGYDGAEGGVPATAEEAIETRKLFADAGLIQCGSHAGYGSIFTEPEMTENAARTMTVLGVKYLMCSGIEGWRKTDRDAYLRSAEAFNRAGAILRQAGIALCYHNHEFEFFALDGGGTGMELLLENTDPTVVKFCPDVYWLACGGHDPAAFITQHADRAVYFHFKDGTFDAAAQKPLTFTELGRGQVDLVSATAAALALNPEWIATEQDKTAGDPAESARISAVYAREVLKI